MRRNLSNLVQPPLISFNKKQWEVNLKRSAVVNKGEDKEIDSKAGIALGNAKSIYLEAWTTARLNITTQKANKSWNKQQYESNMM